MDTKGKTKKDNKIKVKTAIKKVKVKTKKKTYTAVQLAENALKEKALLADKALTEMRAIKDQIFDLKKAPLLTSFLDGCRKLGYDVDEIRRNDYITSTLDKAITTIVNQNIVALSAGIADVTGIDVPTKKGVAKSKAQTLQEKIDKAEGKAVPPEGTFESGFSNFSFGDTVYRTYNPDGKGAHVIAVEGIRSDNVFRFLFKVNGVDVGTYFTVNKGLRDVMAQIKGVAVKTISVNALVGWKLNGKRFDFTR